MMMVEEMMMMIIVQENDDGDDDYPPSGQDTTLRNRMSLSNAPLSSSTDRVLSAGISIDRSIDQC